MDSLGEQYLNLGEQYLDLGEQYLNFGGQYLSLDWGWSFFFWTRKVLSISFSSRHKLIFSANLFISSTSIFFPILLY